MSPQETYRATLDRLFDDPHDADTRHAMLVAGDALEAAGDRAGERIALSEALYAETDPDRKRELGSKLEALIANDQRQLLSHVGELAWFKRALRIDWRGGVAYSALVDARHVTRKVGITVREYVDLALAAPALQHVRRLSIRVRTNGEATTSLAAIIAKDPPLPLEELLIGTSPFPASIAARLRGNRLYLPDTSRRDAERLAANHPGLWLLGHQSQARPLEIFAGASDLPTAAQIEALEAMSDDLAQSRAPVGRALWDPDDDVRGAALRVIAHQRRAGCYAQSLRLLLRPRVIADQEDVLRAVARMRLDPVLVSTWLRRIPGDSSRYTADQRRAAGRALFAIAEANKTSQHDATL